MAGRVDAGGGGSSSSQPIHDRARDAQHSQRHMRATCGGRARLRHAQSAAPLHGQPVARRVPKRSDRSAHLRLAQRNGARQLVAHQRHSAHQRRAPLLGRAQVRTVRRSEPVRGPQRARQSVRVHRRPDRHHWPIQEHAGRHDDPAHAQELLGQGGGQRANTHQGVHRAPSAHIRLVAQLRGPQEQALSRPRHSAVHLQPAQSRQIVVQIVNIFMTNAYPHLVFIL